MAVVEPVSAVLTGLWCTTCGGPLVPPTLVPDDDGRPCFHLKADVRCGGCGTGHVFYMGLTPQPEGS